MVLILHDPLRKLLPNYKNYWIYCIDVTSFSGIPYWSNSDNCTATKPPCVTISILKTLTERSIMTALLGGAMTPLSPHSIRGCLPQCLTVNMVGVWTMAVLRYQTTKGFSWVDRDLDDEDPCNRPKSITRTTTSPNPLYFLLCSVIFIAFLSANLRLTAFICMIWLLLGFNKFNDIVRS